MWTLFSSNIFPCSHAARLSYMHRGFLSPKSYKYSKLVPYYVHVFSHWERFLYMYTGPWPVWQCRSRSQPCGVIRGCTEVTIAGAMFVSLLCWLLYVHQCCLSLLFTPLPDTYISSILHWANSCKPVYSSIVKHKSCREIKVIRNFTRVVFPVHPV